MSTETTAEILLIDIDDEATKENLEREEQTLRKSIKENPNSQAAKLQLAMCLLHQHKFAEARVLALSVLQIDDTNANASCLLGRIHGFGKPQNLEESELYFKRALESDELYAKAHYFYADLLRSQLQRYSEAEKHYKIAMKLQPKDVTSYNDCGIMYVQQKRFDEAKNLYETVLKLQPDHAIAHFNLGNLLRGELKDYISAEKHFLSAIEKKPAFKEALNNYGTMLHHNLKRYNEAERFYLKALQIDIKYARAHFNYANLCREHLKKYDISQEHYVQAIMHDSTNPNFHNNYGLLLQYTLKEYAKAKEVYETALILNDSHALAHCNYGTILIQLVNTKSNKYYNEQTDQFDNDQDNADAKYIDFILNAGYDDELSKDRLNGKKMEYFTKSEWHLRKSISLNESLVMAYNNYGVLLRRLAKPELSKKLFIRALSVDPKFVMAKRNLDRAEQEINKKIQSGIAVQKTDNNTVNNLIKYGYNSVMCKINEVQNEPEHGHNEKTKNKNKSIYDKNTEQKDENQQDMVPNKQSKSQWNCPICTFSNVAENMQCIMCQQGNRPNTIDENKNDYQQQQKQKHKNDGALEEEQKAITNRNNKKKAVELWLTEQVELPQYIELFIEEGYDDMLTITETMTEEELLEIGITKRGHRKKIMVFVNKLRHKNIDDSNTNNMYQSEVYDNGDVEGVNIHDTNQQHKNMGIVGVHIQDTAQ